MFVFRLKRVFQKVWVKNWFENDKLNPIELSKWLRYNQICLLHISIPSTFFWYTKKYKLSSVQLYWKPEMIYFVYIYKFDDLEQWTNNQIELFPFLLWFNQNSMCVLRALFFSWANLVIINKIINYKIKKKAESYYVYHFFLNW